MLDVFGITPHPDDPLQYWRTGRLREVRQRGMRGRTAVTRLCE